ncbi:CPBP family intramembrane metalloprotease [Psychroflexus sp. YR1-1]|uniref:CPBP family intramembrane metalloprotease n=1 Tax=Psychroflexus aurantiacus TaxID=2709310 RepID=A0A6B3QXL5_9FLAO|nr:CPBP family intramembrane glutamic endopeptidase [Psychroflexus aurantiacus]NEV92779.1 CPBP family intramembrane metalloprotease [Psychroflexus aurantiacus]
MKLTKSAMFALSVFTLFGFSAIAYFILSFSEEVKYFEMFVQGNLLESIPAGLGFGAFGAFIGILLLKLPALKETSTFYANFFKGLELDWADILFYSFCAGVGEEILFRGALQPLLGLWLTAIIFVILHGYITSRDWRKSIYGIFLIFISAGFGYLVVYFDIYAAMAAHFIFDVIMFLKIRKDSESLVSESY